MAVQTDNPFLALQQEPAPNPFLALDPPSAPASDVVSTGPTCGDPTCMRSHRPANSVAPGEHYSPDSSTRARQLAEDGKFGGQFGHLSAGRGRRSRRAAEIVAEYAVEAAPRIRKAFADGLDDEQPISIRQDTAKALLGFEHKEHELQLREREQDFQHASKGELVDTILRGLAALQRAGEITEGIVDATVVPDDTDDDEHYA